MVELQLPNDPMQAFIRPALHCFFADYMPT
jgi:hypothetical protein